MTPKYEKEKLNEGFHYIIGCDEVGRGCLAGPVVAAAVILNSKLKIENLGINDSKVLTANQREKIEPLIKQHCIAWSIGSVSQEEVDQINIHNASLLAMRRSIEGLLFASTPEVRSASDGLSGVQSGSLLSAALGRDGTLIAIDGKFQIPNFNYQQEAIIDGDAKILSIAAASIIAKVYRDSLMKQLDEQYPNYQFGKHKGYATVIHRTAIKKFGLTPLHRLTFCTQYL